MNHPLDPLVLKFFEPLPDGSFKDKETNEIIKVEQDE